MLTAPVEPNNFLKIRIDIGMQLPEKYKNNFKYKSLNSGGRENYMSEYKSDHKAKNTPIDRQRQMG